MTFLAAISWVKLRLCCSSRLNNVLAFHIWSNVETSDVVSKQLYHKGIEDVVDAKNVVDRVKCDEIISLHL